MLIVHQKALLDLRRPQHRSLMYYVYYYYFVVLFLSSLQIRLDLIFLQWCLRLTQAGSRCSTQAGR